MAGVNVSKLRTETVVQARQQREKEREAARKKAAIEKEIKEDEQKYQEALTTKPTYVQKEEGGSAYAQQINLWIEKYKDVLGKGEQRYQATQSYLNEQKSFLANTTYEGYNISTISQQTSRYDVEYYPSGKIKSIKAKPVKYERSKTTGSTTRGDRLAPSIRYGTYIPYELELREDGTIKKEIIRKDAIIQKSSNDSERTSWSRRTVDKTVVDDLIVEYNEQGNPSLIIDKEAQLYKSKSKKGKTKEYFKIVDINKKDFEAGLEYVSPPLQVKSGTFQFERDAKKEAEKNKDKVGNTFISQDKTKDYYGQSVTVLNGKILQTQEVQKKLDKGDKKLTITASNLFGTSKNLLKPGETEIIGTFSRAEVLRRSGLTKEEISRLKKENPKLLEKVVADTRSRLQGQPTEAQKRFLDIKERQAVNPIAQELKSKGSLLFSSSGNTLYVQGIETEKKKKEKETSILNRAELNTKDTSIYSTSNETISLIGEDNTILTGKSQDEDYFLIKQKEKQIKDKYYTQEYYFEDPNSKESQVKQSRDILKDNKLIPNIIEQAGYRAEMKELDLMYEAYNQKYVLSNISLKRKIPLANPKSFLTDYANKAAALTKQGINKDNIDLAENVYSSLKYSPTFWERQGTQTISQDLLFTTDQLIADDLGKEIDKFRVKELGKTAAKDVAIVIGTAGVGEVLTLTSKAAPLVYRLATNKAVQVGLTSVYTASVGVRGYDVYSDVSQGKTQSATFKTLDLAGEVGSVYLGLSWIKSTQGRPYGEFIQKDSFNRWLKSNTGEPWLNPKKVVYTSTDRVIYGDNGPYLETVKVSNRRGLFQPNKISNDLPIEDWAFANVRTNQLQTQLVPKAYDPLTKNLNKGYASINEKTIASLTKKGDIAGSRTWKLSYKPLSEGESRLLLLRSTDNSLFNPSGQTTLESFGFKPTFSASQRRFIFIKSNQPVTGTTGGTSVSGGSAATGETVQLASVVSKQTKTFTSIKTPETSNIVSSISKTAKANYPGLSVIATPTTTQTKTGVKKIVLEPAIKPTEETKQEQGNIFKVRTGTTIINEPKEKQGTVITPGLKQNIRNDYLVKTRTDLNSIVDTTGQLEGTKFTKTIINIDDSKVEPAIDQVQRQRQELKPVLGLFSGLSSQTFKEILERQKPPEPPPPTLFKFGNQEDNQLGFGNKYEVEVRKKGIFTSIRPRGFSSLEQAFQGGLKETRSTAAASFRIKERRTGKILTNLGSKLPSSFRLSKRERGVFIQKRSFRISSAGEKKDITKKGLLAIRLNKRKSLF